MHHMHHICYPKLKVYMRHFRQADHSAVQIGKQSMAVGCACPDNTGIACMGCYCLSLSDTKCGA